VGYERAHTKFLGQSQGLAIVLFAWLGLQRLTMCGNLAEEAQGIGFIATFLVSSRELQPTLRLRIRLVQLTG
jgi:hypothetical protein